MKLDSTQRLEILKLEMQLIQSTLDKYDDLIFRNRNWFITIWTGAIGLSFTINSTAVPILAAFVAAIYWFIEGMMRHQYFYKYVVRYRVVREWVNDSKTEAEISIYDLTNHFGTQPPRWERIRQSFLKLEPTVVYLLMASSAIVVRQLILLGII
jgi:hypothetical protein